MPATPSLSVVIMSVGGADALRRCLMTLSSQAADEIMVADRAPVSPADWLRLEFPSVRVWHRAGASFDALRASAVTATRGDIVALTESRMVPALDWCVTLRAAHVRWPDADVVGGAVTLTPGATPRQVALYLSEYGAYEPPLADGPAHTVSAANVSYTRRVLNAPPAAGQWDAALHHASAGRPVLVQCGATVEFIDGLSASAALAMRFHYARGFAGERPVGGLAKRLAYAVGSVALPVVLARRIAAHGSAAGHLTRSPRAALWTAMFLIAWSAGEGVGYLLGPGHARNVY